MRVTVGAKLGSYEIIALLGKGGMGEVYRARDSKLKREVAIKILPDEFALDSGRAGRFQREARVLASLNHPNIAAIYDLLEESGSRFLVLELVEGETLAERIRRGSLAREEALGIATGICEALGAAHEKGVIHRDLKPANVKITTDGKVKVLDFGLAKVVEPSTADADSPTMSGTDQGMILGTVSYMSPEQARGQQTDRTSDVWSFGCVLFEMLAGRSAFGGETASDVLGSILRLDPDWSALPRRTPPAIRKLLVRCLQKDRKRRLHDMADVRIEIEEASESESAAPRPKLPYLVLVSIALALTVGLVGALYLQKPHEVPEERVEINTPPSTDPDSFAVSPDGRKLAYVSTTEGRPRLYLRSLGLNTAEAVPGTEDATHPFWSPDGQSIGFVAGGVLKRLNVAGQSLQTVSKAPSGIPTIIGSGGTWNTNGVIVFAPNVNTPLYRVGESGGQLETVTRLDPPRQTVHEFPQFLPDGQHFLFYAEGDSEGRGVYVGSLQSQDARRLFDADGPAVFASGYLLFVRQGALYSQHFDTRKFEPTDAPVVVAQEATFVSASADVIAYRTQAPTRLVWFDRSGNLVGTMGKEDGFMPEISPDGHWIALQRRIDGNVDVWVLDTSRSVTSRFTVDPAVEGFPIWSPDSKRIVFGSERGHAGRQDLYVKPADGNGEETLLVVSPEKLVIRALDWSPDGRFLLFQNRAASLPYTFTLQALPLTRDGKPAGAPFALPNSSNASEQDARFSPDGRWIAYQSNQSGKNEIYVKPFPGPGPKKQVSIGGGTQARWPRKTKELFYAGPGGKLIAVPLTISADGNSVAPGMPTEIASKLRVPPGLRQMYDVSPDGQRILMSATPEDQLTTPIEIILNWKPQAK